MHYKATLVVVTPSAVQGFGKCNQLSATFPRQARYCGDPPRWWLAIVTCIRAEPRAFDRIDVRATSFCDLSYSHLLDQKVRRFLKVQCGSSVRISLDKTPDVRYITDSRGEKQGWPLSRQEESTSLDANRPESRPLTKAALLDGPGQEDGAYDATEAEGTRARSRREAGLYHRQAYEEPLVGGPRPE